MPKVTFVKSARKADERYGIAVGDSYYWWAFRYGGTHKSKTPPKPSQLTQSDFLSQIYAFQESPIEAESFDDLQSAVDDRISELEQLRDECEEKRSNMPDQLQDSGSGLTLQNRYDSLDEMINDLQAIDLEDNEEWSDEEREQELQNKLEELNDVSYNGE